MANQIRFNIGFNVDRTGLNQLQQQLTQIAVEASLPSNQLNTGLQEAAKTARVVEGALQKAFNVNLGTTNISKFNQELKNNNLTIQQVKNNLSQAGPAGANAFNLLGTQILKTNVQLKESNKLLDSMATSMANTIKWGITSSIFNNITGSIQKAYGYTKKLDTSLNDIRIVTDKSAESMEKFAIQANEAAKGLGASTLDYTQASLIYYQQGLSDEEVKARAETTLKAANVTGQTGAEVSEQLTAVWNGYKVSAQEAELYVDKLAAVAATTAADLEELSTGMSKVASAANLMGVDIDQLNAQLATIVSVTRQAPESVGTALKTIYARMGDIEAGIDTETTLGNYTEEMAKMGFNVLDMNGKLRDMGEVIEEIGSKWSTMSREQQISLSQTVAGTRQYNNLLALFDNWDMYTDAIETSANAMGTLQKQQDIYMESTEAKLQELKTTMQSVYDGLIDTDELNAGVDALTNLAQVADNFIGSFGGGLKSIAGIGVVIANIFNKQIANGINNVILNHKKLAENADLVRTKYELLKSAQQSMQGATDPQGMAMAANYDAQVKYAEQIKNLQLGMKTEEYERLTALQGQVGELQEQIVLETELANQEAIKVGYTEEQIKNFYEQNTSMEDEINKAQQILDKQQEKTQELQEQVNALKEIGNLAKQEELTETQINDIIDITAGINDEILKDKEKEVKTVSDLRKLIEQINKSENNGLNANKKQTKEYQNQLKVLKQIEQAKNRTTGLTQQKSSVEQELNAGIEQQKQSANVLAKVTTVSSALSSVAMTWMSINSLMQTWNDENTSFGDKILQTVMTLGMAIPSLISTYVKLNETTGLTINISKIWNAQKEKNIALTNLENATNAKNMAVRKISIATHLLEGASYKQTEKAILEKIAAETIDIATMKTADGVNLVSNLSRKVGEELTEKQAKALWLKIVAQQAEKTATDAQTTSQLALNAAQLANPVGLVIAGLVALTAAIAGVVSWQAKQLEKENELAQAKIDEINAIQTEIDANTDLYNSYMKINEQYKQGIASKDDMKSAAEKLCETLNIEGVAVANLTGNYDTLTESIINAQKQSLKSGKISAETEKQKAKIKLENAAISSTNAYGELQLFGFAEAFTGRKTEEEKAYDALINNISKDFYTTNINGQEVTSTKEDSSGKGLVLELDRENPQEILQLYDEMIKAQNQMEREMTTTQLNQSGIYADVTKWIDSMTESVEIYRTAVADIEKYSAQLAALDINFYDVKNFDEFENKRQQLIESLRGMPEFTGKTPEELSTIADTYIGQMNDSLSGYTSQIQQIEEMTNQYGEENREEIKNWVTGLSEEELTILYTLDIDETSYADLQNKTNEAIELTKGKKIELQLTAVSDLRESVSSGEEVDEEKRAELEKSLGDSINWEEFDLSTPIEQLEILSQLTDELNQQSLEYYENMFKLEEENKEKEEERLKNLDNINKQIAELKQLQSKAQTITEVDAYQEAIDDLVEQAKEFENEYTIDFNIDIETTALDIMQNKVEDIISQADTLKSAAELIGEGFLVAAEDAQALNDIYPALMENAKVLADGRIQLNQDVVKAIMEGNSAVLTDDSLTTQEQLENKITLLDAEIAYQESKIKALQKYLAGEIDAEELSNQVAQAGAKYEEDLINALGVVETNAAQVEIDNSEKTTNIALQNLDAIGARIEAVSQAYSKMLAGEVVNYAEGGMTAIGGTASEYTGGSQVEGVENTLSEEDKTAIQQQLDTAQAELDTLLDTRSEYTNLLSKLRSGTKDATDALSGAASGVGGKSDSGDKDDKKEEKKAEDEIDRYWELNKAIEEVEESISDLEKTQDKLYGKELIASLKQENILLEEQAKKYHALAEEQRKEAQELQGLLSAYGVVFDTQGGIANYLAASQAALAKYNQAVAAYNASLIDEATFEVAEKSYEAFKKQLERYESLYYDEMRETQNTLDDIRNQQLENNLQAWETEIQLRLDLSEAERDWKNFLKEINEDFKIHYKDISIELSNLLDNAKTYSSNGGTIETDMKALKEVMAEIDKMKNGGTSAMFSSISEAQEKLKELMSALQDDASALFNLYKEAWEAFMEGIDQAAEKFEELMDKFTRIDDELDYQKQLIELIYGEEAYELMDKLYKAQEKNTLTQIDSLKQQKDMWYDLWKNAKEGSEEQAKYYKLWTEAQDELNSKVIDYIELLKSDYLNVVNDIIKTLEKDMTGGLGLDKAKEQWDYQKEQMEEYSKGAEKLLKIETLSLSMQKSINDTTSLKGQQKLQAIYDEQIKLLREKEAITEYDLKMAENRYQIAVQELALEDAKNAKNAMKLTRNAEGNWSYQYVVDDEAILTAQQAKIDLYLEGMELAEQKVIETGDKIYETLSQYFEKYLDIMSDTTLSEEERQEELYELNEKYFGEDGLLQELNKNFEDAKIDYRNYSMGALLASYEADKKAYESMTDEEKKMTQEMINANIGSFAELESKINTNYENLGNMAETVMGVTVPGIWESAASRMADAWNADNGESIKAQCLEAHEAILEALEEYQDKMDEAADLIGEDWSEDGIAGAIEDAEEATEDLSDTTEEMIDDTVDALEDYQDALEEIEDLWYDVKDAIEDAIISAREYLSLQGVNSTPPTPSPNPGPSGDSGNDGGDNGKDKEEEKKPEKPKKETLPEERISMYSSSTGGNGIPTNRTVNKDNIISIAQKTTTGTYQYFITLRTSGGTETGYIDKGTREKIRNSIGLKTGGYTGEWQGGEGKLAFLHSKELVLNAQDTENILNAVQTVRDISDLSNVVGNAIQDKIESMMIKLFDFTGNNYNSNTINNTKDDHSDNIFNITAEFPNVNSVDTIKEAILNLPNYASQYIHQNRK